MTPTKESTVILPAPDHADKLTSALTNREINKSLDLSGASRFQEPLEDPLRPWVDSPLHDHHREDHVDAGESGRGKVSWKLRLYAEIFYEHAGKVLGSRELGRVWCVDHKTALDLARKLEALKFLTITPLEPWISPYPQPLV